jgi:hypothetical protein
MSSFPLHEYWLEHKRAHALELAAHREAMLEEVERQRRGALLGIDLIAAKLEVMEGEMKRDAHNIVKDLATRETEAWRRINAKERKLYELQRQLNDQMYGLVEREKELEMRESESERRCVDRRKQVEEWATDLQQKFIHRESELRLMTRNVESDLGVLFAARRRDVIECSPTRHLHNFAAITYHGADLPRVVIGEPVRLEFTVTPHEPLVGMPVVMTYLEGRAGSLSGKFVTAVQENGSIIFDDISFHGPTGSSHVVLVSMSRVAAGTIEGLELPIHLKATPSVRAVGSWNVSDLSLSGSLRVLGVEPFSLFGQTMPILLSHFPSGVTVEGLSTANETNEFSFQFAFPTNSNLSWDDISAGKVYIEANVPASKFTTPFFHKFQVICHSPHYPSFQFPPVDRQRDCGMVLASIDLPYGELVTDVVMCDGGNLAATADVGGTVNVYRLQEMKWIVKHRLQHESFVSVIQWASGGSHLALLEPKRNTIHVWSLTDLLLRGEDLPISAQPTAKFRVPMGSTVICPVPENPPACLVATTSGVRLYRGNDFSEMTDRRTGDLAMLRHAQVKRGGGIAFLGYADGEVIVVSLSNRKVLCTASISTKDTIMDMCTVGDSKFAVSSKRAVMIISSTPAWATMQCSFRTPSPLRSIALQHFTPSTTRLLLLHDDGHVCLISVEDARVLSFTALPDINGVSAIQAVAADRSKVGRVADPNEGSLLIVGCAALRPFAFDAILVEKREGEGSANQAALPVSYEAAFKRRSAQNSTTPRGTATSHSNKATASLPSTPRTARGTVAKTSK